MMAATARPCAPRSAQHWQHCGLLPIAVPLVTGAQAFSATPRPTELWTAEFLAALAEEAEAGIALLRRLERQWLAARAAIRGRRRDSHAAAAVDILAAAPIVSATSLAHSLDIAIKNAAALLDVFVARGIAIEVTHRSKRRLFGLKHLAPLRETAALPRRALRHRGRGTLGSGARGRGCRGGRIAAPRAAEPLQLTPLERKEFEFSDLDDWMREADQLIRRSQAVLDEPRTEASAAAAVRRRVIAEEARGYRPDDPCRTCRWARCRRAARWQSLRESNRIAGRARLTGNSRLAGPPRGARRTRCRCHRPPARQNSDE